MLDHAAGVPIRQLRGDASAFNPMLLKASSSGLLGGFADNDE